jgi:hypothetical protein
VLTIDDKIPGLSHRVTLLSHTVTPPKLKLPRGTIQYRPMAEPLRWDMTLPDGEPLRWDDPRFTWDGFVPETNTQKIMTQNLITLDVPDADWTDIDAALLVLETKLGAKLLDLTVEQRSDLNKMGDKSEAFCRQALINGRQNVASLPAQTVTDLTAEEGDLAALDKLRPRLARLTALKEKTADTEMALGSDIMVFSLFLYGVLKAIGAGAGLDELRVQLKARFVGRPKKTTTTPTT